MSHSKYFEKYKTFFLIVFTASLLFVLNSVSYGQETSPPMTTDSVMSITCFRESVFKKVFIERRKLRPLFGHIVIKDKRPLYKIVYINDYGEVFFTVKNSKTKNSLIKTCLVAYMINGTLVKNPKKLEYKGVLKLKPLKRRLPQIEISNK